MPGSIIDPATPKAVNAGPIPLATNEAVPEPESTIPVMRAEAPELAEARVDAFIIDKVPLFVPYILNARMSPNPVPWAFEANAR